MWAGTVFHVQPYFLTQSQIIFILISSLAADYWCLIKLLYLSRCSRQVNSSQRGRPRSICLDRLCPLPFRLPHQLQSVLFCVWEVCGCTSLSPQWPAAPLHSASTASRRLPSNAQCPWQRSQQTPPLLFSLYPSIRAKLWQSGEESRRAD